MTPNNVQQPSQAMKARNLIKESTYDGVLYFGTFMEKVALREIEVAGRRPMGLDFLKVSEALVCKCQSDTAEEIERAGQPVKDLLCALGTTLSLLDQVASCSLGCSRGDHVLEYIMGRVIGYSQSTFLLIRSGLYDEALLLIRSVAEVANLFALFVADPTSFTKWKLLTDAERIHKYGPGAVRKKLNLLNVPPPCDNRRYSWLCEVAAHATPHTRPQVHGPHARPSIGAEFQQDGFRKALRELSLVVASIVGSIAQLADLEDSKRNELTAVAKTLLTFT